MEVRLAMSAAQLHGTNSNQGALGAVPLAVSIPSTPRSELSEATPQSSLEPRSADTAIAADPQMPDTPTSSCRSQ